MKKGRKLAALLALSAAFVLGTGAAAMAATLDDPITSVEISLDYELVTGMGKDDIQVDSGTDGVDSVTITSVTNANYGKKPQVTIKVKADTSNGSYFDKEDASEIRREDFWSISGSGEVTFKSAKRTSNSVATVTVALEKIGGDDRSTLDVDTISWDGDSGVVYWDAPDDATSYSLRLTKGSSKKNTVTTTNTWYDFSELIRSYGTGEYYVSIKGKNGNYSSEEWTDSETFDVTEDNLNLVNGSSSYRNGSGSSSNPSSGSGSSASNPSSGSTTGGAWLQDANGWWYCNADRSYTTNNWQQIDGYWYYFNGSGYLVTGWLQSPTSGLWYYLATASDQGPLGHMLTNAYIGSYYVNADGVWVQ